MDENVEHGTGAAERLEAAAERLEKALAQMEERQATLTGDITKIVATVDTSSDARCQELERKLAEAVEQITELKAQAAAIGRKTVPVSMTQLLAKQGLGSVDGLEGGTLDNALAGLSLEERVALKAQLIRTGVLA